ncbi:MAG TPA: O-antigen ligase family protein [Actinomycetota bacterium]|jgi:O-antigen ligase|nr:O-antigen ligase family protein [Actinomycetota bacterium]
MKTSPQQADSRSRSIAIAVFALPILGYTAGLPEYIEFSGVSLHLVVALALGALGWIRGAMGPSVGRYLRWSALLAVWFLMSSIATWRSDTIRQSLIASVWLVIVGPGIANLLRDVVHRRALLAGMIVAALHYSFTAIGRRLTGREMFDLPLPSRALLLGEKRGFVNARLLYVIPFLVSNVPGVFRRARWLIVGFAGATVLLSGDRASLLVVPVVALTFALLQPGGNRRVRTLLALGLTALVFLIAIDQFGGQSVVGRNRLLSFVRGERTTSDDIRELQLKRAWHVGVEHPAFGIGYGNLAGLDHPALDEARNSSLRGRAQNFGVHNTYAQIFGELGVPGAAALLLLLGSVFAAGIKRRGDPEVRAAMSGYSGLLVTMMVNPMSLPFLYLVLAYLVGLFDDVSRRSEEVPNTDRDASSA